MASGGNPPLFNKSTQDKLQKTDISSIVINCDACKFDQTLEKATGFCVTCTEYLCDKCSSDHRKNKITRNHTLLTEGEMPEDVDSFKAINQLTKCQVHVDHNLSYECFDHKVVICVMCLSERHRKCDNVIDLSTCTECDDTHQQTLNENQDKIDGLISQVQRKSVQLVNAERIVEDEIQVFSSQLKQTIDVLKDKLLSELKHIVNSETETNHEAQRHYEKIKTDIEKGNHLLQKVKAYGTRHQITIVNRYVKGLTETITQEITNSVLNKTMFDLSLKKDSSLLETKSIGTLQVLSSEVCAEACGSDALSDEDDTSTIDGIEHLLASSHMNETSLGDVPCHLESTKMLPNANTNHQKSDKPDDSKQLLATSSTHDTTCLDTTNVRKSMLTSSGPIPSPRSSMTFGNPKIPTKLQDRLVGKSRKSHQINTQTDEYDCTVSAMALLSNGNIVLADRDNSKIKLFSSDFHCLDEVKLPENPTDMCVINGVIYICCLETKKIFWLTIEDRFSPIVRTYPTRLQPISVSEINSELLILFSNADFDVVEPGDINIEIRNKSSIQAEISYDSADEAFEYVEDAKRIHRLDSTEILLAENDRVSCYNVDLNAEDLSERLWYYKSHGKNCLEDARGIAKDSEGNVYVCGRDSNNVHQVSSKNYRMNRVIVSNINAPVSVCVDEKNDRLLVGCDEDNYVHSYSMT